MAKIHARHEFAAEGSRGGDGMDEASYVSDGKVQMGGR